MVEGAERALIDGDDDAGLFNASSTTGIKHVNFRGNEGRKKDNPIFTARELYTNADVNGKRRWGRNFSHAARDCAIWITIFFPFLPASATSIRATADDAPEAQALQSGRAEWPGAPNIS